MSDIKRVLIINRGEIAFRIIKTLKYLNIVSAAIYLPSEANSPYVMNADIAIELKSNNYKEFLNQKNLIEICKVNNIDAVHLGYGLLSENSYFIKLLEENNITHIGASSEAMQLLGNKYKARELADKLLIQTLPGALVESENDIYQFLEKNKLPILLKASYGGGGYGIDLITNKEEIKEKLARVIEKSKRLFDRSEIYIEKYIENVRHLEVQGIVDKHGNVDALGIRDCSIQENRQKLIEETLDLSLIDPEEKDRLYRYTKLLLKHSNYAGVATCEFLYSPSEKKSFYIETNTRLQVEHTVTEEQYDIDLIKLSIAIAENKKINIEKTSKKNHVIEFRINMNNTSSKSRHIEKYIEPHYPWLRIDSGVNQGLTVSDQFNSMISKVIVKGGNREEAIRKAYYALSTYQIEGINTSIPLYLEILKNKDYRENNLNTRWFEKEIKNYINKKLIVNQKPFTEEQTPTVFTYYPIKINNSLIRIGVPKEISDQFNQNIQENSYTTTPLKNWNKKVRKLQEEVNDKQEEDLIKIKIQSTLVKLEVMNGDSVKKGDPIAVIEAMKMEQVLYAPKTGKIMELNAKIGDSLKANDILCKFL